MTLAKKIVLKLIVDGTLSMDDIEIEGHSKEDVKGAIRMLHKNGLVNDFFRGGNRFFYVDTNCKVPRLTTYGEILELWK